MLMHASTRALLGEGMYAIACCKRYAKNMCKVRVMAGTWASDKGGNMTQ
jgi:hypothetical protein